MLTFPDCCTLARRVCFVSEFGPGRRGGTSTPPALTRSAPGLVGGSGQGPSASSTKCEVSVGGRVTGASHRPGEVAASPGFRVVVRYGPHLTARRVPPWIPHTRANTVSGRGGTRTLLGGIMDDPKSTPGSWSEAVWSGADDEAPHILSGA